jgi:hypothetical protein
VRVHRDSWRACAPFLRSIGGRRLAGLALGGVALGACASLAFAQSTDQQIRCYQLQQDLAASSQGGGANPDDLARLDKQIAQYDRVFQGTQAAMQDAGCFESFFIFGKALVRSPQCLNMNDRVEDARRQLAALQQQRMAMTGGGGNRRRQAELQDALARAGCGGQVRQPQRRGGGLFDFFGGGQDSDEEQQPQTPIYRSIDPNGRYRAVCVRLCDGFYYPLSFATTAASLAQEADRCQSSCAAPAELYVYRNPGQEIEQAISLNGSAYMDLPVALKFRKTYVNGCSCKQAEYDPAKIEEANKRAEAEAASKGGKGKGKGKVAAAPAATPAPAPQAAATPPAAAPESAMEVTGSTEPTNPPVQQAQKPPAPPAAAAAPAQPAQTQAASAGSSASGGQPGSSVVKKTSKPATPPSQ